MQECDQSIISKCARSNASSVAIRTKYSILFFFYFFFFSEKFLLIFDLYCYISPLATIQRIRTTTDGIPVFLQYGFMAVSYILSGIPDNKVPSRVNPDGENFSPENERFSRAVISIISTVRSSSYETVSNPPGRHRANCPRGENTYFSFLSLRGQSEKSGTLILRL
ncbi:hypothetical protein PUN28_000545 [Cardiocondyla obscurior]|uniref:Uncharacterized protein n=1 Tax=Cardiocondyla obscurior TaxID=286306 RepID=A0AAW2GZY8_9HYME